MSRTAINAIRTMTIKDRKWYRYAVGDGHDASLLPPKRLLGSPWRGALLYPSFVMPAACGNQYHARDNEPELFGRLLLMEDEQASERRDDQVHVCERPADGDAVDRVGEEPAMFATDHRMPVSMFCQDLMPKMPSLRPKMPSDDSHLLTIAEMTSRAKA